MRKLLFGDFENFIINSESTNERDGNISRRHLVCDEDIER